MNGIFRVFLYDSGETEKLCDQSRIITKFVRLTTVFRFEK